MKVHNKVGHFMVHWHPNGFVYASSIFIYNSVFPVMREIARFINLSLKI